MPPEADTVTDPEPALVLVLGYVPPAEPGETLAETAAEGFVTPLNCDRANPDTVVEIVADALEATYAPPRTNALRVPFPPNSALAEEREAGLDTVTARLP